MFSLQRWKDGRRKDRNAGPGNNFREVQILRGSDSCRLSGTMPSIGFERDMYTVDLADLSADQPMCLQNRIDCVLKSIIALLHSKCVLLSYG